MAGKDEPCREWSEREGVAGTEVGGMERTDMVVAGVQPDMAVGSMKEGTDIEDVEGLEATQDCKATDRMVTEGMKMQAECSLEEHFL